ncbi:MAG: phosphatidate cytidylyltransferase [Pseudomonadales bacterium]|nr:phosphatidate cytidylyltransferase [Pseudomonadales bacterium]
MLKQRVLTALVLVPLVIWSIFGGHALAFVLLSGAIVTVGAWEWARLMEWSQVMQVGYALFLLASMMPLATPACFHGHQYLFFLAVPGWLWALRQVINYPEPGVWQHPWVLPVLGWGLLVPSWLALIDLNAMSPWWLMYLLLLVWGADTGAYFAGRAWGHRKLAPDVSPGKTVEGLLGGLSLTLVVMMAVGWFRHLQGERLLAFIGISLLTVLASVLGDLLESMFKRYRGIKDSGGIFPGHGGALDRIDSLTAAAPIFMAGWLLAGGF